jgi:hypothetical protein
LGGEYLQGFYFPFQVGKVESGGFHDRHHLKHLLGDIYGSNIIHIRIFVEKLVLGKTDIHATEKQYCI